MSRSIILHQLRNAQSRHPKLKSNPKLHLHRPPLLSNQSLQPLSTTSLAQMRLFLRVTTNKATRRTTTTTKKRTKHCQYHLDQRRKRRYSRRFRLAIYLLRIRIQIQTKNTNPLHLSKRFVRINEDNELVKQSGRKSTAVRLDISILTPRKRKNYRDPRDREREAGRTRVMIRYRVLWMWLKKRSRK